MPRSAKYHHNGGEFIHIWKHLSHIGENTVKFKKNTVIFGTMQSWCLKIQSYLGQVLSYRIQTQSQIGKKDIFIWESSVIFKVCFDMVDFFFQQTLDNQQKNYGFAKSKVLTMYESPLGLVSMTPSLS